MFHVSMGMLTHQLYGAMNRTGGNIWADLKQSLFEMGKGSALVF